MNARTEHFLRRRRVSRDVVFRHRSRVVAVPVVDGTAHQDNSADLFGNRRIFLQQGRNVGERPDGHNGGRSRQSAERGIQKVDGASGPQLRAPEVPGPAGLLNRKGSPRLARHDGHAAKSGLPQQFGGQPRPRVCISADRCDAQQFQFRASRDQGHCKRIVDVGADIGVQQDGNFFGRNSVQNERPHEEKQQTDGFFHKLCASWLTRLFCNRACNSVELEDRKSRPRS